MAFDEEDIVTRQVLRTTYLPTYLPTLYFAVIGASLPRHDMLRLFFVPLCCLLHDSL